VLWKAVVGGDRDDRVAEQAALIEPAQEEPDQAVGQLIDWS
jgi:hypothetical protein